MKKILILGILIFCGILEGMKSWSVSEVDQVFTRFSDDLLKGRAKFEDCRFIASRIQSLTLDRRRSFLSKSLTLIYTPIQHFEMACLFHDKQYIGGLINRIGYHISKVLEAWKTKGITAEDIDEILMYEIYANVALCNRDFITATKLYEYIVFYGDRYLDFSNSTRWKDSVLRLIESYSYDLPQKCIVSAQQLRSLNCDNLSASQFELFKRYLRELLQYARTELDKENYSVVVSLLIVLKNCMPTTDYKRRYEEIVADLLNKAYAVVRCSTNFKAIDALYRITECRLTEKQKKLHFHMLISIPQQIIETYKSRYAASAAPVDEAMEL